MNWKKKIGKNNNWLSSSIRSRRLTYLFVIARNAHLESTRTTQHRRGTSLIWHRHVRRNFVVKSVLSDGRAEVSITTGTDGWVWQHFLGGFFQFFWDWDSLFLLLEPLASCVKYWEHSELTRTTNCWKKADLNNTIRLLTAEVPAWRMVTVLLVTLLHPSNRLCIWSYPLSPFWQLCQRRIHILESQFCFSDTLYEFTSDVFTWFNLWRRLPVRNQNNFSTPEHVGSLIP